MSKPRKANVSIQYNGKDVSTKLSDFLKTFSYTDVASGESDSMTVDLSNIDKRWINQWFPSKGDKLITKIITSNWIKEGESFTFKCGSFILDDINFNGYPLTAKFGALSIPITESFRTTERTKTWKSVTIESIASEIAKRAKVSLSYEGPVIKINKLEQSHQTDCDYLKKLCESYGLAMKVYSNKIVIFDEAIYENKKSILTIKEEDLKVWSYNTTLTNTYTGAEIAYTDVITGKNTLVKVGSGNRILKINEIADNLRDAELKALAKVNNANKNMTTMKITIMANPRIIASSNINIKGLGKLDGKYAVSKVKHVLGSEYNMSLELRKIQKRIGSKSINNNENTGDYIVKKGDTLWSISKSKLGSGARYLEIYNANKEVIENAAKSRGKANSSGGNLIYPGTILKIPV